MLLCGVFTITIIFWAFMPLIEMTAEIKTGEGEREWLDAAIISYIMNVKILAQGRAVCSGSVLDEGKAETSEERGWTCRSVWVHEFFGQGNVSGETLWFEV